jgi:hypothetical protein
MTDEVISGRADSERRRLVRPWQPLGLLATFVIAAGALGATVGHRTAADAFQIPSTLGGMSASTDPQLLAQAADARNVSARFSGSGRISVNAYGSLEPGPGAVLIVLPATSSLASSISGASAIAGANTSRIGQDTCSDTPAVTICGRASSAFATLLALYGGKGAAQAAAMLDEAWQAQ